MSSITFVTSDYFDSVYRFTSDCNVTSHMSWTVTIEYTCPACVVLFEAALSADNEAVKSQVISYFTCLLAACQSVNCEDDRLFTAMKRFHRTERLSKRNAEDFASTMHMW